MMRTD